MSFRDSDAYWSISLVWVNKMNKFLSLGIILSASGTVICTVIFIGAIYFNGFIFEFKSPNLVMQVTFLVFTSIMLLGSFISLAILFIDSNKRKWDLISKKVLFQRMLFSTFPIGNIIYYYRIFKRKHDHKPSFLSNNRISYRKKIFLDTLFLSAIILIIGTLLTFALTLFSPAIFYSFPDKMLFLAKLAFGFLIATGFIFECFYLTMVIDVTKKILIDPEKIPSDLKYFPDPIRPGRGAFTYYFKVLRKELK